MPYRRQDITWTNANPFNRCRYAARGRDELIRIMSIWSQLVLNIYLYCKGHCFQIVWEFLCSYFAKCHMYMPKKIWLVFSQIWVYLKHWYFIATYHINSLWMSITIKFGYNCLVSSHSNWWTKLIQQRFMMPYDKAAQWGKSWNSLFAVPVYL